MCCYVVGVQLYNIVNKIQKPCSKYQRQIRYRIIHCTTFLLRQYLVKVGKEENQKIKQTIKISEGNAKKEWVNI